MRLLSYLNVSNGDDLERDSGFLFQRALLEELATRTRRGPSRSDRHRAPARARPSN